MGFNEYGAEKISGRPLEFIWILDTSGSMAGDKIQSLNYAIRECIPEMRRVAGENPNAEIFIRALTFSSGVNWHTAKRTDINDFNWSDVSAGGLTSMGAALSEVANALDVNKMADRGLPPVLVLISDGEPTDDFQTGLTKLLNTPWGGKAVKIAIAIGDDADLGVLRKFINNVEIEPLVAKNSTQLFDYIKWASTQVLGAASQTKSTKKGTTANVQVPQAPTTIVDPNNDVW